MNQKAYDNDYSHDNSTRWWYQVLGNMDVKNSPRQPSTNDEAVLSDYDKTI